MVSFNHRRPPDVRQNVSINPECSARHNIMPICEETCELFIDCVVVALPSYIHHPIFFVVPSQLPEPVEHLFHSCF